MQEATVDIELPGSSRGEELNAAIDLLREAGVAIQSITNQAVSLETVFAHHTNGLTASERSTALTPTTVFQRDYLPAAPPLVTRPTSLLPGFWRIAPAFLRRDLLQEASYRLAFLLQFANILFSVLVFYFISELLGEAAAPYLAQYGGDYFSFVLIGIAFLGYFSTGLSSFAGSLRHAQTTGTLEAMLATPTRLSAIILASSLWDYLVTTLRVVVFLLLGSLLMRGNLSQGNYPAALLVLALTVVIASSLGIIAASFVMVIKRGDPINWGFGLLNGIFGGVYFPITLLPALAGVDILPAAHRLFVGRHAPGAAAGSKLGGAGIKSPGAGGICDRAPAVQPVRVPLCCATSKSGGKPDPILIRANAGIRDAEGSRNTARNIKPLWLPQTQRRVAKEHEGEHHISLPRLISSHLTAGSQVQIAEGSLRGIQQCLGKGTG